MRVHPTVLRSANAKWHFPVAVLLLLGVIVSNLMRGSDSTADAASQLPMKQVVVVKANLERGQELSKDMFVLQNRPVATLPADHVTSWEEIQGKVPVGLVPAGFPLAKALLADPKSLEKEKPSQPAKQAENPAKNDPFAKRLKKIEKSTVAIGVNFGAAAPPRGARAALSLKSAKGRSALVAEEVWVEFSNNKFARLRVPPTTALFIEEAASLGTFSYFLISEEGASPFAGQAVKNIDELNERLGLVKRSSVQDSVRNTFKRSQQSSKLRPDSFSSYAWVTGSKGVRYSVGKDGRLFVITEDGQVNPLYNHRLGIAPNSEDAQSSPAPSYSAPAQSYSEPVYEESFVPESSYEESEPQTQQRRVESGLEPLFPLMGLR